MKITSLPTPLFLGLLIVSIAPDALGQKPCPLKAAVGEIGLRRGKTIKKVMPEYPQESVTNRVAGRAVARITIDANGEVIEATVSTAPDKPIGEAVADAAKRWLFHPPPMIHGQKICLESTLGFRFELKKGVGKVLDDPVK